MTLFGWTMKQLGVAKKHFSQVTGENIEPTTSSALHIMKWWKCRRIDNPLESVLIGCEPEADMDWACAVWTVTANNANNIII